MASYAYNHVLGENEHLHYDEEEQLLSEIEDKFEKSMGRLHKSRERHNRILRDEYLEERKGKSFHKDLYDPDLGDSNISYF
jgi:hypothetical protein